MSQRYPPHCHPSKWLPVLHQEARSTWEYPWRLGFAQHTIERKYQLPACTSPGQDLEEDKDEREITESEMDEEEEGAEEEEEQEQDEGGRSEAVQTSGSRMPPWKSYLQPGQKRRSLPWHEEDDSAGIYVQPGICRRNLSWHEEDDSAGISPEKKDDAPCTPPQQEDAKSVSPRPRKFRRYPPREVENDLGEKVLGISPEKDDDSACTSPEKEDDSPCTSPQQEDGKIVRLRSRKLIPLFPVARG